MDNIHCFNTMWRFVLLPLLVGISGGQGSSSSPNVNTVRFSMSEETRLMNDLVERYAQFNPHVMRPVINSSQTVTVHFGLSLIQILDFNEKDQLLTTLVWKTYEWHDEFLTWNKSDYGGVSSVHIKHEKLWNPDIVLYNNVGKPGAEDHTVLVLVNHSGHILWSPPVLYQSSCIVDMRDFPFDEQVCTLRLGPWTHTAVKVNMEFLHGLQSFDMTNYVPSSEWGIKEHSAQKRIKKYSCCPDEYADMVFSLRLERQMTFHMRLILVPTVLLSIMSCAIFWIPPNRPDRTTLGLGLFSAFFLLLILVLSNSPATPESRLGTYYVIVILLVSFGVLFSVVIVNIGQMDRKVPPFLDKILSFMGCVMCRCGMTRNPGQMRNISMQNETEVAAEKPEDCSLVQPVTTRDDVASTPTKVTPLDRKKWQDLAFLLDRIVFIIFLFCIIISFLVIFPSPSKIFL